MISVEIELEVECECGNKLEATVEHDYRIRKDKITVCECTDCTENARAAGYEEGYNTGLEEAEAGQA